MLSYCTVTKRHLQNAAVFIQNIFVDVLWIFRGPPVDKKMLPAARLTETVNKMASCMSRALEHFDGVLTVRKLN